MPLPFNYEIRWKNYRCFQDTGWIVIRPLTILIGPNNAGKTSVISPILLLNQTMTSRDAITPLVTRGPLVDAGTFKDIVYNRDLSREIFLGFRFHVHDISADVSEIGQYPPGALEISLRSGEQPQDIILKRYELFDIYKRLYFRRSRRRNGTYTLDGLKMSQMTPAERRGVRESRP
jgi:hypothetical protein